MAPRFILPLAFTAAILAGCATTNRVGIAPEAGAGLDGTSGRVLVPSPEIAARIPGSNVAGASIAACSAVPGGFLVGALIGAASSGVDSTIENQQSKTAEQLVTPIRDALVGVDTPQEVVNALRTALAGDVRLNSELLVLERQNLPKKDVLKQWLDAAPRKTLLLVRCDYYFTADFGRVSVEATVDLITADGKLQAWGTRRLLPFPSLYHNFFATGVPLVDAKGGKEANAAAWRDHGERLRAELLGAFREIAAMVAYDLKQPTTVADLGEYKDRVMIPMMGGAAVQSGGMVQMKARLEREAEGRRWMRAKTGELISVD